MGIFKRGNVWWYHFVWNGERIQRSTKQGDADVARDIEATYRTALAKGEVGILDRKPVPTLKDFAQRFIDHIQVRCAEKPSTVVFYASKLANLLRFDPIASAKLDTIDESLVDAYVQHRSAADGRLTEKLAPASINRELATLRRALRLAYCWKLIDRIPLIHMLKGERSRSFVLSRKQEETYLGFARQPLRDIATMILDGGQRIGEALRLTWDDVDFTGTEDAPFGNLYIRSGKSRNARRSIPMSRRVRAILEARRSQHSASQWVFPDASGKNPFSSYTLRDQHAAIRTTMRLEQTDFVIHSLRHTCLTRLGENRTDVFTLKTLAGHSSVVVTERYVTTSEAAKGAAILSLEAPKKLLLETARESLPATLSATLSPEQVDDK